MGEKIRDINSFKIGNTLLKVELNDGYSKDYSKYDIHIQNDLVQYCLSDGEFMRLASAIITAKRRLDSVKENTDKI